MICLDDPNGVDLIHTVPRIDNIDDTFSEMSDIIPDAKLWNKLMDYFDLFGVRMSFILSIGLKNYSDTLGEN